MTIERPIQATAERSPHDTAAEWLLREEAGRLSAAERRALDVWLEADDTHRSAWDDVRRAVAMVGDNAAHPELIAMRSAALAARREDRPWLRRLAGAAGVAAVLAGAGWMLSRPAQIAPAAAVDAITRVARTDPNSAVYRTAVGERSAISLPDGSVATLDTDSILKVAYTGEERGVRLLRGQALFDVAKHKAIPFQVYAGDRRITAVGTRFNVRLDGAGRQAKVSVALLEGVVKVSPVAGAASEDRPTNAVTMAAGELLVAKAEAPVRVAAANTERVASWRSGVLIFDDAPLGQAVDEMNRYTTRPISVADAKLDGLRVSGVFKTGDPERFAETLAEVFPILVGHDASGSAVLRSRD